MVPSDPITRGQDKVFLGLVPHAKEQVGAVPRI